jgi:DNA-binding CsgD family transcriptional regulator
VALDLHVGGLAHDSTDELVEAAAAWGELGRRLDQAEALADAARMAAMHNDRRRVRLLGEAVEAFVVCDAEGAAARLESDLETTSGHRRAPAMESWASLTPTEFAVAVLVGEGLTNSEIAERRFVSRRTIESHLIRVCAKVEHSSRTRLAVEASERSAAGGGSRTLD